MPSLSKREKDMREESLQKAIHHYENSVPPNIWRSTECYSVPYSTLRGRLTGSQNWVKGQAKMQALTEVEEKAIVR